MVSQNRILMSHLIYVGGITTRDASRLYNIDRLSARIYNLRNDGHIITTHRIDNAPPKTSTHAKYTLDKANEKGRYFVKEKISLRKKLGFLGV